MMSVKPYDPHALRGALDRDRKCSGLPPANLNLNHLKKMNMNRIRRIPDTPAIFSPDWSLVKSIDP